MQGLSAQGLCAQGLRVRHGRRAVLDGVDFALNAGELGVILGPNGAGKSTLLGVLGGLRAPDDGAVWLHGRALTPATAAGFARHRAYLPQDLVPAFDFSVQEVVELGRYPHRHAPESDEAAIVREALQQLSVLHLLPRRIRQLSGGERARVQIARCLAQVWRAGPDRLSRWLLLDEPTAALDLQHQHATLSALRDWAHTQGVGVLLVLHDLNLALRYADRCWVLDEGRVRASGTPAEVLTSERVEAVWRVHTHRVAGPGGVPQLLMAA
ncbi:MAG: heme ABC transporter ATP-binding protein [Hydrogenophaga sp.]|nr:heme ABC transporter ATP-binding protein [Hydrogenophaga sp.]